MDKDQADRIEAGVNEILAIMRQLEGLAAGLANNPMLKAMLPRF